MDPKNNKSGNHRLPPDEPYLQSTDLDYLVRMNAELLSELWIARDRIAVLEQVLVDRGVIGATDVDSYVPDDAMTERLETLRRVVVENVLGAPFKNQHTVQSLREQGRNLASTYAAPSPKQSDSDS